MKQRKRVFELARELGTRPSTVVHLAEALQIKVIRAMAELTPGQEVRIRDLFERGGWRERERRDRQVPPVDDYAYLQRPRHGTCTCCGLHYMHDLDQSLDETHCAPCREHYAREDEDPRNLSIPLRHRVA